MYIHTGGWEHGKSQDEQKSLIPFCNFRNS